jgi:uncharacterized membrane protein
MFKDAQALPDRIVTEKTKVTLPRIDSVDFLRGIVMVLMALDHVRDYFTNAHFDPLDLSQTNAALFFTRWITHFCAPVFVFLAGTGAFLSSTRGKTKPEISKFLFTRGLWLIFLELTVVRFGWLFNFDYTFTFGQVIWAIGWSMIALSALIYLSANAVGIFGIVIIAVHNLFDGVTPGQAGVFAWLWQILHYGGGITFAEGYVFFAAYPLIPWIGVMTAGYGFGKILLLEEKKRNKILIRLGLSLSFAFIIIRAINFYGDANTWTSQKSFLFTFLDFMDTTKYPPSLLYLLMTLGPAIAILPLLEKVKSFSNKFFVTFGRVPMFYYIIHIPFIHLLAVIFALLAGINPDFMFSNTGPWAWTGEWGYSLFIVYLVWVGVVLSLYPLSLWFSNVKKRKKNWWLSYL